MCFILCPIWAPTLELSFSITINRTIWSDCGWMVAKSCTKRIVEISRNLMNNGRFTTSTGDSGFLQRKCPHFTRPLFHSRSQSPITSPLISPFISPFIHPYLPSGKHTKNYGKSPFLMGKSTINHHFQQQTVKLPEGNREKSHHNQRYEFSPSWIPPEFDGTLPRWLPPSSSPAEVESHMENINKNQCTLW